MNSTRQTLVVAIMIVAAALVGVFMPVMSSIKH